MTLSVEEPAPAPTDTWGRADPGGVAAAAPLVDAAEYFGELLAVVQARLAAAIYERWELGILAETGDAASALFLDRRRVEALLAQVVPATSGAAESARGVAQRRMVLLGRRLEAARGRGLVVPLADALEAWSLSEGEQLLLGCVLGAEVSPTLARLLSYLGGDATRPGVTIEAAAAVMRAGDGGVLALTGQLDGSSPLRRLALVTLRGGADLPFLRRTLQAAPRLFALARGIMGVDERLTGASLCETARAGSAVRHLARDVAAALTALTRRQRAGEPIGVVVARRGVGAAALLADLAAAAGRPTLTLPTTGSLLDEELAAAAIRETLLHRAMLVVVDESASDPAREAALGRFLDRLAAEPFPVALVIERADAATPRPQTPVLRVDVPIPDAAVRHALWTEGLGAGASGLDLDGIASAFHVGAETIERASAGAAVLARENPDAKVSEAHVAAALRAQVASDLSSVATRLEITQKWEDLVVPDETGELVVELIQRARQRRRVLVDWGFAKKVGKGLGLVALFGGRPGTGKSMAAGLIARELGLDAYQIDISRILSKWIGETEKSLGAAFEAAEAGQAMLIFDEADALFSKRVTDVKTSTDRYANVETNYILNRLEWFTGIAVLTTNLEGNLDPAFRRRVSLHAQFPFPDEEHRVLLWQAIIPREAPTRGAIPYAQLAHEYQLSGGQIRNVALRAAYLAAAAGEPISLAWIQLAAERQYQSHGKLVAGGELE